MKVLFAHNAYLGQFQHFAHWMKDRGHEVMVLHRDKPPADANLPRVRFSDVQQRATGQLPMMREVENALCSGLGAAQAATQLRDKGYTPDVIIAHCGWGTGLLLKQIWPNAVYIAYHEWYYNIDALEDPEKTTPLEKNMLGQAGHNMARNMPIISEFIYADACWSPNAFQAGQFPRTLRDRIFITHDGVDTDLNRSVENAQIQFPWLDLSGVDEIVTYIGRGFEPTRGFPDFMKAIDKLLRERPETHVVIVGANRVAYGSKLPAEDSWLHRMVDSLDIDLSRIHFTGTISLPDLRVILAASSAHVYLTVPFVLSWSLGEAMSIGCR